MGQAARTVLFAFVLFGMTLGATAWMARPLNPNTSAANLLSNEPAEPKVKHVERVSLDPEDATNSLQMTEAVEVIFDLSEVSRSQLTPRETQEQLRDWLMFTAVAQRVTSDQQLRDIFHDVPPVRYGTLEGVTNFSFGETRFRWRQVGEAIEVIALVPADATPAAYHDYIADIADEALMHIGRPFYEIDVISYEVDELSGEGKLQSLEKISYQSAFSSKFGHVEEIVTSLPQFEAFIGRIDDVTSVKKTFGNGIKFTGRKLKQDHRGIRTEHIASLWLSENHIDKKQRALEKEIDDLYNQANSTLEREQRQGRNVSNAEFQRRQRSVDAKAQEMQLAAFKRGDLVNGSGFSLDPTWSFEQLVADIESISGLTAAIKDKEIDQRTKLFSRALNDLCVGKFASGVNEAEIPEIAKAMAFQSSLGISDVTAFDSDLQRALRSLKLSGDSGDDRVAKLYALQDSHALDVRNQLVSCSLNKNQYQQARYDGDLKGTETGMILFYTDVLAKIWAINYQKSDPSDKIDEFVNLYNRPLSPIYRAESAALPSARLWFGHNYQGFSHDEADESLLMARISTRIYAAGSNPINPGDEVQTSRLMGAPMKWWNDHYADVANYEPEYQRLNQIMKWSLIFQWLDDNSAFGRMSYLGDVYVNRSHWFPDWLEQNQADLKFTNFEPGVFSTKAERGNLPEAMDILFTTGRDAFGGDGITGFSGGVSLAPRGLHKNIKPPAKATPIAQRRSTQVGRQQGDLVGSSFKSELTANNAARNVPASDVRLQGIANEVSNLPLQMKYSRMAEVVSASYTRGDASVGVLSARMGGDGRIRVGFQSGKLDIAQDVARAASRDASDLSKAMSKDTRVEATILNNRNDPSASVFVKFKGETGWVEVRREPVGEWQISRGWSGRAADRNTIGGLLYRPVQRGSAVEGISQSKYVRFASKEGEGIVVSGVDSVPGSGRDIVLDFAGVNVKAKASPTGTIYLEKSAAKALKLDAPELALLLKSDDVSSARRAVSSARSQQDVVSMSVPLRNNTKSGRAIETGSREDVLDAILRSPKLEKAGLDDAVSLALREAVSIAREGQTATALRLLDELAKTVGETADIQARRAVVQLLGVNKRGAASTMNEPGAKGLKMASFEREVDTLMRANPRKLRSSEGEDILSLARAKEMDLKDDLRLVVSEADTSTGGTLKLQRTIEQDVLGSADEVPITRLLSEVKENPKTVDVYAERASLPNLDWSSNGFESSVRLLVSENRFVVVRLSHSPVSAYSPSQIVVRENPAKQFDRVTRAPRIRIADGLARVPRPGGSSCMSVSDESCLIQAGDEEKVEPNFGALNVPCVLSTPDCVALQPRQVFMLVDQSAN